MKFSFLHFKKINSKKAVSPVIATLLLVAVAVVGSAINFGFSQQYFNLAQASGLYGVESIVFLGYDASDTDHLTYHDGISSNPVSDWHGNQISDGLNRGERIAIYLQNNSVEQITLAQIRLAGNIYSYQSLGSDNKMTPYTSSVLLEGGYTIVKNGNPGGPADIISAASPTLQPGQLATIVIELDENYQLGRDMQFKIITGKNNAFVYTVASGQNTN